MWQHNIWCVYVRSVWRGMPDCILTQCVQGGLNRGVNLTTHPRFGVDLKISESLPLLPVHVFMSWARTAFHPYL